MRTATAPRYNSSDQTHWVRIRNQMASIFLPSPSGEMSEGAGVQQTEDKKGLIFHMRSSIQT